MSFGDQWRNTVNNWGCLDDGPAAFGLDYDDVVMAAAAMQQITVSDHTDYAIVLPLQASRRSDNLRKISDSGSTKPGVLCQLPLLLGDTYYQLRPSLMSSTQWETVLGSIETSGTSPIHDIYSGEISAVPAPLSKLTFGKELVERFLQYASFGLGVTLLREGIIAFEDDIDNVYPTLNLIWQDCIDAIASED